MQAVLSKLSRFELLFNSQLGASADKITPPKKFEDVTPSLGNSPGLPDLKVRNQSKTFYNTPVKVIGGQDASSPKLKISPTKLNTVIEYQSPEKVTKLRHSTHSLAFTDMNELQRSRSVNEESINVEEVDDDMKQII